MIQRREPRLSGDEILRRGTGLYESKIRALVQPAQNGRMLAIDVETGDYAVADETLEACQQLIDKNPDAQLFSLRIGYILVQRLGRLREIPEER